MPVGFNTFVRLAGVAWRWCRGEMAHRLNEAYAGLPADLVADTARQVMRWSLPLEDTPEDALSFLLRDHGMPAYIEPYANTLIRVKAFMDDIPYAGSQSMLERQAVYAGLVNPVVVPDLPNTTFSITADNVGFQSRYGDPGLKWGDPLVYGSYVEPNIAKNIRAMLAFFRPARERYTGIAPTAWTPALFEPESWFEAKHGTEVSNEFTLFTDQGKLGGTMPHNNGSDLSAVEDLPAGGKLAVMSGNGDGGITHSVQAFYWRGLQGVGDGFLWFAGVFDATNSNETLVDTDSTVFDPSFRLVHSGGGVQIVMRGPGGSVILNLNIGAAITSGHHVIAVSFDSSLGAYGGVTVYVDGTQVSTSNYTGNVAPNNDPAGPLTIGQTFNDFNGFDGKFHGFGWVKGRPAIVPDLTLLNGYYATELTGSAY